MGFSQYEKVLDLSSFKLNRTDDSNFRNNYQMLSLRQLGRTIDSLKRTDSAYLVKVRRDVSTALNFPKYLDTTGWKELKPLPIPPAPAASTATSSGKKTGRAPQAHYLQGPAAGQRTHGRPRQEPGRIERTAGQPGSACHDVRAERNDLRNHQIAWHEKITLSVACLVMFLIGAPLGSIIRKGGIGLPLIFAVIFFVIFFMLNNFGKKFVKQDVLTPISGMWLATYVLTPVRPFPHLQSLA